MRRNIGLILLVGLTAGVTWGIASADPATTALCVRVNADVRAPSSSGSCPSGYTKTGFVNTPLPLPIAESVVVGHQFPAELALDTTTAAFALPAPAPSGSTFALRCDDEFNAAGSKNLFVVIDLGATSLGRTAISETGGLASTGTPTVDPYPAQVTRPTAAHNGTGDWTIQFPAGGLHYTFDGITANSSCGETQVRVTIGKHLESPVSPS